MTAQLLKDYMEEHDLSQSQVSGQIGKSTATINQYLQDKYKGDVKAIDKLVMQLIERARIKAQSASSGFVKTSEAKRIMSVCARAHAFNDIYLVIGEAGLGKTEALKEYARINGSAVLIEVDPSFNTRTTLTELCFALNVSIDAGSKKNIHAMMVAVIEKLKRSDQLLIIDEAELLSYRTLEVIRRIHDKSGAGVVLSGLPILRANLRGKRGEYKQLYSRVGLALDLGGTLPEKDIHMLCESALATDQFNECLNVVSKGNARRLDKIVRGTKKLSEINGVPIDEPMINQYADMLID